MESRYRRTRLVPKFHWERGTSFDTVVEKGFAPGALSISGRWTLFNAEGIYEGKHEVAWQWNVAPEYRKSHIILPWDKKTALNERFKTILLRPEGGMNRLLLLFEATSGLVWQRNIRSLIPIIPAEVGKEANPYNVNRVGSIACSGDGAFTLVALTPQEVTAEVGGRLLVFDQKGKLISQKEFPGTEIKDLNRNGLGDSFQLSLRLHFEDGKRLIPYPKTAVLFLRKDGAVAGVFAEADGSLMGVGVRVSDDDAIAVDEFSGSLFPLP